MKLAIKCMLLLIILCLGAGLALAKCTEEEMYSKARQVMTRMERLEQSNNDEYMRLLLRFNNKARLLDENDIDAWCDLYDQMLLEI